MKSVQHQFLSICCEGLTCVCVFASCSGGSDNLLVRLDCSISLSPEHASIIDYDVFVDCAVSIDDVLLLAKGYAVWVVDVDVAFGGDSRGHPTVSELLPRSDI